MGLGVDDHRSVDVVPAAGPNGPWRVDVPEGGLVDGRVSVVTSGRFGHEPGQHGGRIPAAMRCFEWCTGLRGPGASSKAAVSGATVSAEEAVKATLIRHGLHCAGLWNPGDSQLDFR